MTLVSTGLANGGQTAHYQFQYDDSLSKGGAPIEPARTNQLLAAGPSPVPACEQDFNQMSSWFGNIALDVPFRIPVNVTQNGGGAAWNVSNGNLTVTINPASAGASVLRYFLVSEMTEQFMRAQGKGWFGQGTEGSVGEGLSRFLAAQLLATNGLGPTPSGSLNSNNWMQSPRSDFINNPQLTDDGPDAATGCSLLFIYYLFSQLGFSVNQIVAAGASTLAGVYHNLTGDSSDPFPAFRQLLEDSFPGTTPIPAVLGDNPFPLQLRGNEPRSHCNSRAPSAAARTPNRLDVFWIGPDGGIGSTGWESGANNNEWEPDFPIARPGVARADSPIASLTRTVNRLDVFWIGPDGGIGSTGWEGGANNDQWEPDFPIARPGVAGAGSGIAAVARTANRLDVFWIGPDGGIGSTGWEGGANNDQWEPDFPIARPGVARADSPIAAVSRTARRIDVFWIGPDGGIGSTAWEAGANDNQWEPDFPITRPGVARADSPIAAVTRTPNRIDVFWIGPDGGIGSTAWEAGANDNQWEPDFPIARPGVAGAGSGIAAVARTTNRLDVFWIGPDGGIGSTGWESGANNNQWEPDFPIARPGVAIL
jgi:hypothetical protein